MSILKFGVVAMAGLSSLSYLAMGQELADCLGGFQTFYSAPRVNAEAPYLVDLDGDGLIDMVTLDNTNMIRTYHNTGTSFAAPSFVQGPAYSWLEGIADIDNDGKQDIVIDTANHNTCGNNSMRIFWNSGDSSQPFTSSLTTEFPIPSNSYCIHMELIDFDNNGDRDLIVTNMWGPSRTYKNLGQRQFQVQSDFAWPRDLEQRATFDFDGDGNNDFLALRKGGWADGKYGTYFYRGNGDGTFQSAVINFAPQQTQTGFAFRNGSAEIPFSIGLYVGSQASQTLNIGRWHSDGNFAFTTLTIPTNLVARQGLDLDSDGKDELILTDQSSIGLLAAASLAADGLGIGPVLNLVTEPEFEFQAFSGVGMLRKVLVSETNDLVRFYAAATNATYLKVFRGGCAYCVGDVNQSGTVDSNDLATILTVWGTNGGAHPRADIDHDGIVNAPDLGALLGAWGHCTN